MSKLSINTPLDSVVVCGSFCDWNIDRAIRADRVKGQKYINVNDMPVGEYRVFSCKNFLAGEVYPTDGRQMPNRYYSGEANEIISSYF